MQPIPVLANEVDWLVVLNELSQIQPANTVDAGISLIATPPATASSTTSPATAAKSTATAGPTATETIGTLSTTVTVPNLPSVTAWGQAMNSGGVLTSVLPSGTLTPLPSGVTFPATMNISGEAQSQRLAQFEEPLP